MRVTFLLHDGFSNLVLACLMEPLRAVRDAFGHEIHWSLVTPNGAAVTSSSGLSLTPDGRAAPSDLAVIVSGYGYQRHAPGPVRALCRGAERVIAADTGAWLLAEAGLLEEGRATTHWQVARDLAERHPDITVTSDRFVRHGRFITCGGASAALEVMLAEIEAQWGKATALQASMMFGHDAARIGADAALADGREAGRLAGLVELMLDTLDEPLDLDELARRARVSKRTLNRLMLEATGLAPMQYHRFLRLSRARDLAVNPDLSMTDIAAACGYATPESLSKAFKQSFGVSLGLVRRR